MAQIAAYATPSGPRYGLVADGVLHEWDGNPFSDRPVTPGKAIGPLDEQTLVLPVTPTKLVCIGRNYAAHAAEHQAAVPDEPMLFLKPPSALIPHRAPIRIPPGIGRVDHEAELAVIIGRRARRVRREDALDYVLGYTCANDVSARDFQKKDGQWGRAKGFDTFCPLGPVIATELDPSALDVRAILNGELRQNGNTRDMVFDVPFLIAFISAVMTLEPGDVILTGTPEGVSPIAPGDEIAIEVEGVGTLRNPVVAEE
jgi:2-keto-4-pentenoate hydratase/2-oxohepta-3-ene-1,7-dioic acid hydratase in catechol pathway